MKPCIKCGARCETYLARLCDSCFEIGSKIAPPRQTGRTFQLIKQMDENKRLILVVHTEAYKRHLEWEYPWLHNRIKTVHDNLTWMRSMIGTSILIDPCVTEFWDRDTDEFMRYWYSITPS